MAQSKFDNIFSDDPLGLLAVQTTEDVHERTDSEQRLIDSFEEINEFYEATGQEPQLGADIGEFMLASRLQGIRQNPSKVKTLLPFDFYNLLKCEESKSVTVEDILGDDPLNLLLDSSDESDIFSSCSSGFAGGCPEISFRGCSGAEELCLCGYRDL